MSRDEDASTPGAPQARESVDVPMSAPTPSAVTALVGVSHDLEALLERIRGDLLSGELLPTLGPEGLQVHLDGAFQPPEIPPAEDPGPGALALPAPADFVAMLLHAEVENERTQAHPVVG